MKDWRTVKFNGDTEKYLTELLELELHEREVNRINRLVKTAGFNVIKTLDDFVMKLSSMYSFPETFDTGYFIPRGEKRKCAAISLPRSLVHSDMYVPPCGMKSMSPPVSVNLFPRLR